MSERSTTVVWTQDFDFTLSPSGPQAGKEEEVRVKGRCAACWGGLALRGEGQNNAVSRIKCRVCKKSLTGEAAADEYRRRLEEAIDNAWRASMGFSPTRERGRFVCKLFPQLPRRTEDEVRQRIASKTEQEDRSGWLTRSHCFACELTMKAISLTVSDEARRGTFPSGPKAPHGPTGHIGRQGRDVSSQTTLDSRSKTSVSGFNAADNMTTQAALSLILSTDSLTHIPNETAPSAPPRLTGRP